MAIPVDLESPLSSKLDLTYSTFRFTDRAVLCYSISGALANGAWRERCGLDRCDEARGVEDVCIQAPFQERMHYSAAARPVKNMYSNLSGLYIFGGEGDNVTSSGNKTPYNDLWLYSDVLGGYVEVCADCDPKPPPRR